jgi:hypothetical protein
MELPKVSIDLPIVLEPYKLALVLSGLDVFYSEIMVPDSLQFIEVWSRQMQPITFYPLKEDLRDWQNFFGLDATKIAQNNFIAGLTLLYQARKKGMVTVFESEKYVADGQRFLNTNKYFNQFYNVDTTDRFIVNTDMPITLEGMLGYELNTSTKAIFGDLEFANYLNKIGLYEDLKTSDNMLIDQNTDLFLKSPQGSSVNELIEFILNKQFFEASSLKIISSKTALNKGKDIGLTTVEFGSTYALDTFAFHGLPVSTGALFLYRIANRLFKK